MFFKRNLLLIVILVLVSAALVRAHEGETRTYEPRDRGLGFTFEYPLDTYSVRDQYLALGIHEDFTSVMGGEVVVEPNDLINYQEPPVSTYRIKIAAVPNEDGLATDDLESLLGELALIRYDQSTLRGIEVQTVTLGEASAVRVDNLPYGPAGITTHIIAYYDNLFYEIVVEPVSIGEEANLETVEAILNSFEIKNLME